MRRQSVGQITAKIARLRLLRTRTAEWFADDEGCGVDEIIAAQGDSERIVLTI